jgi:hypothetical protein
MAMWTSWTFGMTVTRPEAAVIVYEPGEGSREGVPPWNTAELLAYPKAGQPGRW